MNEAQRKIYIVVYRWDYEMERNILITYDKVKAYDLAKKRNRTTSSGEHYDVEEMEVDKLYE